MEAERLLSEWEVKEQQLEGELTELQTAIAALRAQLSGSLPSKREAAPQTSLSGKNRKGENLRIIQSFLGSLNGQGATTSELSAKSGIGQSSVYVVLKRHPEVFAKGNDGLWRLVKLNS